MITDTLVIKCPCWFWCCSGQSSLGAHCWECSCVAMQLVKQAKAVQHRQILGKLFGRINCASLTHFYVKWVPKHRNVPQTWKSEKLLPKIKEGTSSNGLDIGEVVESSEQDTAAECPEQSSFFTLSLHLNVRNSS